jgi:hypothetical protein
MVAPDLVDWDDQIGTRDLVLVEVPRPVSECRQRCLKIVQTLQI